MTLPLPEKVRRVPAKIRSGRVDLIAPDLGFADELVALLADPSIHRWTGTIPSPYQRTDAADYVRRARANRRAGQGVSFLILRCVDGRLLGGIGLHDIHPRREAAEVGYWIGRPFRGQGFAGEALDGVLGLAFGRLGLHRVYAGVFPGNRPSVRLLRRAGFRYEGRIRDEFRKDGVWQDALWFARLSTDRPPRTARGSCP